MTLLIVDPRRRRTLADAARIWTVVEHGSYAPILRHSASMEAR